MLAIGHKSTKPASALACRNLTRPHSVRARARETKFLPQVTNPQWFVNASKSGKQIERSVISTFLIAWSIGSKGEFRQREHLLALPLRSNLTADL